MRRHRPSTARQEKKNERKNERVINEKKRKRDGGEKR
jgi:hypothetical protein